MITKMKISNTESFEKFANIFKTFLTNIGLEVRKVKHPKSQNIKEVIIFQSFNKPKKDSHAYKAYKRNYYLTGKIQDLLDCPIWLESGELSINSTCILFETLSHETFKFPISHIKYLARCNRDHIDKALEQFMLSLL